MIFQTIIPSDLLQPSPASHFTTFPPISDLLSEVSRIHLHKRLYSKRCILLVSFLNLSQTVLIFFSIFFCLLSLNSWNVTLPSRIPFFYFMHFTINIWKVSPSTSMHFVTRVRRSHVVILSWLSLFLRLGSSTQNKSEQLVSCIHISLVNFVLPRKSTYKNLKELVLQI